MRFVDIFFLQDDIKAALNKVMQKLERENAVTREVKQREKELTTQMDEMRAKVAVDVQQLVLRMWEACLQHFVTRADCFFVAAG